MGREQNARSVDRLNRAIVANDAEAAAGCLREDAFIGVPGHEGSGRDHLSMLLQRLHTGEFRAWSAESADVLVSDHHGIVLDRWICTQGPKELDQHVTVVAADSDDGGRFGILSVYGYDSGAIGRFFGGA